MNHDRSVPWRDPVTELYKGDVDRTLLQENLKLSPEQRVAKLQDFVKFLSEMRVAGKKASEQR